MTTHPVSSHVFDTTVADATQVTTVNPANTDDVVAQVQLTDGDGFASACRATHAVQRSWAQTPAPVRGRAIQQFGRLVEANAEALSALITREIGKPIAESRGEVQEVVDTANFFLSEGRRLYGQTVPSEMPAKQLYTYRRPVGTVAVITAGNFPVAVPSWYIIPALVAGNTVVWKPAEYSAAIADAFAQLLEHAGIPEGVVSTVFCDGPSTFAGLEQALQDGSIQKVGFTGSSAVGVEIGRLTGQYLQRACLELGGKNPMVIMPDADLDLAVEGALFSGFGTSGQRCTSLGTVIALDAIHDEFLAAFDHATRDAVVGDPTREDVLYGPMMSARFADNFEKHLTLIEDHHTTHGSDHVGRITADAPRAGFTGDAKAGIYMHPTIASGVKIGDALANTETFGPLVGVARAASFEDAIELANAHGYGLSSSIYTTSPTNAFTFREQVTAGMVSVNNSTSGAEAHLPFGGNGKSGNGSRQSGIWVLDEFTSWQSMNWDWSGALQKAQMDVEDVDADLTFRLDG